MTTQWDQFFVATFLLRPERLSSHLRTNDKNQANQPEKDADGYDSSCVLIDTEKVQLYGLFAFTDRDSDPIPILFL